MRFFILSIGSIICAIVILIIIRFWGLAMPHYKYDHEFYQFSSQTKPLEIKVFHSFERTQPSKTPSSPIIQWVDVFVTSDHLFVIDTDGNLNDHVFNLKKNPKSKLQFKGRYLENYSFLELQELKPDLLKLEQLFQLFNKNKYILSIKNNAQDIHKDLITLIEKNKMERQVMIQSDYDIVIKSIKEERPLYTFGTSISEIMRLKTFSTIYLTPAISIKGDALTSVLSIKNRSLVNQEIVDEIKRRQKLVFLGPLNTPEEVESAKALNPDGLIIN